MKWSVLRLLCKTNFNYFFLLIFWEVIIFLGVNYFKGQYHKIINFYFFAQKTPLLKNWLKIVLQTFFVFAKIYSCKVQNVSIHIQWSTTTRTWSFSLTVRNPKKIPSVKIIYIWYVTNLQRTLFCHFCLCSSCNSIFWDSLSSILS